MQNEIVNILKKEEKFSEETIEEIREFKLNDFADIIKEVGQQETEYLNRNKISDNLNTETIGKEIYIFKEVMSTNTVAKFLSQNDVSNGTVVLSEKQSDAKGRLGKHWESPLGGIWLSIIVNPNVDHSKIPMITLATGVAVVKTLERIGIENAEIKWPNDVLINGKKISGILTEAITKFNTIDNVIIGVGIDANFDVDILSKELQEGTTTLDIELGHRVDENEVITIFLEEFEKIAIMFNDGEFEAILKEWRNYSYSIGKIVEVREPFSKSYDAYVLGISREGALVVEKIDGTLEKVISGECIIKN
ncbi:MAG: biotin--[Methanobrevibacter sp.]|uniref:Biotin--[acetyl-CoA-carboxylase] ligase n=1 Tax=Methanobrevibacter millerae TaxID=230361 RepID=A0A8T3V9G5_9EURY|nr:biotin--[acetyl-CoA-carboxylase] ligase [Methanobrevibacter millerae]MBE6504377.1 biotin--[acetyl-CoA-carboxylase] ligase [Methanobrevibacter millerae]MBR0370638.1 biotin--[acetyl-CoA-carboxylase] ligase [Methanobrevibacter sp.]